MKFIRQSRLSECTIAVCVCVCVSPYAQNDLCTSTRQTVWLRSGQELTDLVRARMCVVIRECKTEFELGTKPVFGIYLIRILA